MRLRGRRRALIGVVVPAYDVAAYLPACLDSILAQQHRELDVVVVDDGSPDQCGDIAEQYAARDSRVRVVHTPNRGLGAARNEGARQVRGDHLAFVDSDDVVPPTAYAALLASLQGSGSAFATGAVARWESGRLHQAPWMRRLHRVPRVAIRAGEHPELLGDVFAWNKLFRRDWWDECELSWPEGVRYEDQPTTTSAYLSGRFDVLDEVVYHWRIRDDGSSITQRRSELDDLRDRWVTKRMSLARVEASEQAAAVRAVYLDRVLAGDLWQYFRLIPDCSDEWWALLVEGVQDLWRERSLTHSGLPPVHRLTGWLVQHERRDDAAAVMRWSREHGGPAPRVAGDAGVRIDVPVIDPASVPPEALALRSWER